MPFLEMACQNEPGRSSALRRNIMLQLAAHQEDIIKLQPLQRYAVRFCTNGASRRMRCIDRTAMPKQDKQDRAHCNFRDKDSPCSVALSWSAHWTPSAAAAACRRS